MTDTSLISSEASAAGAATADATTADTATVEGGAAETVRTEEQIAEKLYDAEDKGSGMGEDKREDPKPEDDANSEEGDGKAKSEEGDKEDEKEKGDDKDEGKEDEKSGEPLDLSDIDLEKLGIELPEGIDINQEAMKQLGEVAGELNLDKESAAKLIPVGIKVAQDVLTRQQAEYKETRTQWAEQVAADKEIGGADEAARKEKLAVASKGLDAIGTPELRSLLNETGLGDNPEVIRAFYKAGLAASEDVIEKGGSGSKVDPLDAMYPSMRKE